MVGPATVGEATVGVATIGPATVGDVEVEAAGAGVGTAVASDLRREEPFVERPNSGPAASTTSPGRVGATPEPTEPDPPEALAPEALAAAVGDFAAVA